MKALIYSLIVASLVSGPALSADVPSLVGTWTGQRDRIAKVEGRRGGLATLVITQQQGNTFVGHLKRSNPTGDEDEQLWGAFAPDGQLMMGSDEEGTYISVSSTRTRWTIVTARRDLLLALCVPGLPGSPDVAAAPDGRIRPCRH